jgi:siroheme synthase-like protein
MVVGLSDQKSAVLASIARLQGILVNVEDKPEFCDFYFTSFIERGELMIAVSTHGASPTLAQEIKSYLGEIFGHEWEDILGEIKTKRLEWKQQGLNGKEIGAKTRRILEERNLLHFRPPLEGEQTKREQSRVGHENSLSPLPFKQAEAALPQVEGNL